MLKYSSIILLMICVFTTNLGVVAAASDSVSSYRNIDRSSLSSTKVKTFAVPVLLGVEFDSLVPDFGDSRGDGTRFHEGQDMRAPLGTPIVSPTKAIVTSVGNGVSSGKYVYTANPGGETFRYMHLDTTADIKRGDKLAVGDFIGTVGDTGNAPDGVYHLHFEVKNKSNVAIDPYERLSGTPFTIKQKILFLDTILEDIDNVDDYAEFLVTGFPSDFASAKEAGVSFPKELTRALKDTGVDDTIDLLAQLQELIALIPSVVPTGVGEGDSGVAVSLLQTYLIFNSEGSAADALSRASATGYYGSITTAAVKEYQLNNNLKETGIFNAETKEQMS